MASGISLIKIHKTIHDKQISMLVPRLIYVQKAEEYKRYQSNWCRCIEKFSIWRLAMLLICVVYFELCCNAFNPQNLFCQFLWLSKHIESSVSIESHTNKTNNWSWVSSICMYLCFPHKLTKQISMLPCTHHIHQQLKQCIRKRGKKNRVEKQSKSVRDEARSKTSNKNTNKTQR